MHPYEAFSFLDKVNIAFGPAEFGRVSQILLGFSFIECEYKVPTMQLSGRPDIIARNENNYFVLEVKTSNSPVIRLKKEDLQGINGPKGSRSIIAALNFPEVEIRWILADATKLRAGEYSRSALRVFSLGDVESEINHHFFNVLEKYHDSIMQGTDVLLELFREVQKRS